MKKITLNRIKCNYCGDIITSTSVHDFVTCRCGSCSVDGGNYYLRREYKKDLSDYTELSEYEGEDDEVEE